MWVLAKKFPQPSGDQLVYVQNSPATERCLELLKTAEVISDWEDHNGLVVLPTVSNVQALQDCFTDDNYVSSLLGPSSIQVIAITNHELACILKGRQETGQHRFAEIYLL